MRNWDHLEQKYNSAVYRVNNPQGGIWYQLCGKSKDRQRLMIWPEPGIVSFGGPDLSVVQPGDLKPTALNQGIPIWSVSDNSTAANFSQWIGSLDFNYKDHGDIVRSTWWVMTRNATFILGWWVLVVEDKDG